MKPINNIEFDHTFDENEEDIVEYLELTSAKRPNQKTKRVNVDFPLWMVESLDKEAAHLGVPRQALIKLWISEKLPVYKNHLQTA